MVGERDVFEWAPPRLAVHHLKMSRSLEELDPRSAFQVQRRRQFTRESEKVRNIHADILAEFEIELPHRGNATGQRQVARGVVAQELTRIRWMRATFLDVSCSRKRSITSCLPTDPICPAKRL